MKEPLLVAGDYTGLAQDYSRNRPDYCPQVLDDLLALLDRPAAEVDCVDVGAGTGIWTRMVAARSVRSLTAIEPNEHMRSYGIEESSLAAIRWLDGRAESTGLSGACCDWVTVASALHWTDFDRTIRECHRILRPGGMFTALWNSRQIEGNPLLMEIEAHIEALRPGLRRVSSGRSGITTTLADRLESGVWFGNVQYTEGRHTIRMAPERYLGAWRSVNDLQTQVGPALFTKFLQFVERRIRGMAAIEATYLTRAWSARRRD